ncbi:hypothetical protein SELMODRAFT_417846 [Selaginella moellendorffii]|uniref:Uncharacterized protein n=1 Tax=Selaginella moellendorffii TaxID=88036 RepID=D8S3U4_SELML|nr:hypothetical protein SELMODRAFT_417846 [Selaginella moellendorffii]
MDADSEVLIDRFARLVAFVKGYIERKASKEEGENKMKGAGCFPTKAKAAKIDEAKAEGAASSSHIWGKTNPLKFPAYLYTKGVFKANHPLIKIVSGEELMPAFDKFALPLLVDAQVRRAAIFLCSTEFTRFYKLYGKASNEKQLTEFHHSLVRELEKLTIPSGQTLKKLEGDQLLYESLTGKKRKRTDLSDIASFSDQLDMLLQHAPVIGEDGEESTGAADLKVYVLVNKLQELVKKLVAIIEFKFTNEKQAGFQGTCYACKEAPINMHNSQTNPIYVLCFSERWKRSILHLRGEVSVKNGTLDRSSLPAFRKTEKMMGFKDPIPEEELVEMLQERTAFFQRKYSQAPQSLYPDNMYLVGTLYTSDEWHELPRNELFGGGSPDTHRLYEGLLRIIIGDAVLKWSKEMLNKVVEARESIRMEERVLHTDENQKQHNLRL